MEGDSSGTLPSWATLLVRSREGDDVAFEELVRACERRVLAIAYQITGNLEDAQDVAQDSFLRIYRSRDRFQDGRSFEAWLYRIVVNAAKNALASRRRRKADPLEETSAADLPDTSRSATQETAEAENLSEKLILLLEELSPRLRSVFVLKDLQGMETPEIARILSCTETTVRRHSAEARIRLRALMEKRYPSLLRQAASRSWTA